MKVLITGIKGMIGSNLALILKQDGYDVVGIDCDDLHKGNDEILQKIRLHRWKKLIECGVDVFNCDITKKINVDKFKDIDLIIHLAAKANISASMKDPSGFLLNNVNATVNIFELARELNIKVVYASSSSVYGNSENKEQSEIDELSPLNPYACGKVMDELTAKTYFESFGVNSIGARFFTVYGPMSRPDMFVFSTMRKINNKEEINLYNSGNIYRDFTSVDDICQLLLKSVNRLNKNDNICDVINFGQGQPNTVLEVVNVIGNIFNTEPKLNLINGKPDADANGTCANVKRRIDLLGSYEYETLEEGLIKTAKWYQSLFIKLR